VAAVHGMQTPPRRDIAAEQHAAATGEACTFVCISDTHSKHADMAPLPPGDVLLHAGDMTVNGSLEEVLDFAAWWHAQPHAQKFIIAGASRCAALLRCCELCGVQRTPRMQRMRRTRAHLCALRAS
jgi:hypothetical protein